MTVHVAISLLIMVLAGFTTLRVGGQDILAMMAKNGQLHLATLALDLQSAIQRKDLQSLSLRLKAEMASGDIGELRLSLPDGQVMAFREPPSTHKYKWLEFSDNPLPVLVTQVKSDDDRTLGRIELSPSPMLYQQLLWKMIFWWLAWTLGGLTLIGVLLATILKINLKDLFRLEQAALDIEQGNACGILPVNPKQPPELRQTITAFNQMSTTLQSLLDKLHRQQIALNEEKEHWEVTLSSISDAIIVTNENNCIAYMNPAAESLLETPQETALSMPICSLLHVNDPEQAEFDRFVRGQAIVDIAVTGSLSLAGTPGKPRAMSCSCSPLDHRHQRGAIYVLRDETEKRQAMENLRLMAFHDSLTSLPNRRAVEGRLTRALREAKKDKTEHVFCYIDLDQFKLVNDTCGHSAGDLLLAQLAKKAGEELPDNAYLGRLGGDEFGLILFDAPITHARAVCHRLIRAIQQFRFNHNGRSFSVGACAGITRISSESRTLEDVMIQADMACYRAKAEGSGLIRVYEADEIGFRRLQEEMVLAADFTQALEAGRFMPYRQLIRAVNPYAQSHYEVLVRVRRAAGEIEGPGKLLSALERYGQAPILDRWMMENVLSYLARQPDDSSVYFINLSGKTLADESFLATALELLDRYQLPGERIGFEITETAAVVNLNNARRLIEGLRERGCRFGLDDFGREASSFSYLKHLPADYIKIDGSFVHRMSEDSKDRAIVRSIIQLSKDFGLYSVAEHVENEETALLLGELGVDYLQGYHVHRPESFPQWEAHSSASPLLLSAPA